MRKPIIAIISTLLVALLILPGVAVAKNGNGRGADKGAAETGAVKPGKGRPAITERQKSSEQSQATEQSGADNTDRDAAKQERKTAKAAAKQERKAQKNAAKQARKAEKNAAKEARKEAVVPAAQAGASSMETSPSTEPSETVDASGTPGPGITNAFSRIGANLEKSLAKIADGKKKQLPPGLVKVWIKFATWLGIDLDTRPGYVAPTDQSPSTYEPTSTVQPTSTVEPTDTASPPLAEDTSPTVNPVEPSASDEEPEL